MNTIRYCLDGENKILGEVYGAPPAIGSLLRFRTFEREDTDRTYGYKSNKYRVLTVEAVLETGFVPRNTYPDEYSVDQVIEWAQKEFGLIQAIKNNGCVYAKQTFEVYVTKEE